LNKMFGTRHVRLDGFTPEERVQIETALGQKIDWEGGAIRASQGALETRDKVLVGSKVAAYGSGAAAGAALGAHFLGFGASATTGAVAAGDAAPMGLSSVARDVLLRYGTREKAMAALARSYSNLQSLQPGTAAYIRLSRSLEVFEAAIAEAWPLF